LAVGQEPYLAPAIAAASIYHGAARQPVAEMGSSTASNGAMDPISEAKPAQDLAWVLATSAVSSIASGLIRRIAAVLPAVAMD